MVDGYFNAKICAECGGRCCQAVPAPYHPDDIKRIFGGVEAAIKSGIVAIDWWESFPEGKGYFMRPRVKGDDRLYSPTWGGACMHWTQEKGCALPPNQRPYWCRLLEPRKEGACVDHRLGKENTKFDAAMAWHKSGLKLDGHAENA